MAYIVLTYGVIQFNSDEILNISWRREFNINSLQTVNLTEITQPGNLSSIEIDISARITNNAMQRFNSLQQLIAARPLRNLNLFNLNMGNYYMKNLNVFTDELSDTGDILRMNLEISFKQNLNFG